jgi:hypothetical protein
LTEVFYKALDADMFPALSIAAYFGMAPDPKNQTVFGVWLGLRRYGLLTKAGLTTAIRENKVKEIFVNGAAKLAAKGHGYSRTLGSAIETVEFELIPQPFAEDPVGGLGMIRNLYVEAIDSLVLPQLQTLESQTAAWVAAEASIEDLLKADIFLDDELELLQTVYGYYKEAEQIYHFRRDVTRRLKREARRAGW